MAQITYADKVAMNENPNVADINKVKANDMNEIKSVVNANDDNVGTLSNLNTTDKSNIVDAINEVISNEGYSTTEIKTSKTYNNKPVYRKVITDTVPVTGTDGSAVEKRINIASNIDKLFIILFQITNSTDTIPCYFYNTNAGHNIKTLITDKQIQIRNSATVFNGADFLGIVEYTKTTD